MNKVYEQHDKKKTTTAAMPKKFSFYKENVNCFYNFPSLDLYFFAGNVSDVNVGIL